MVNCQTEVQPVVENVCASLDKLIELADLFQGLVPSVMEANGERLPGKLPPAIDGQREGDRAWPGTNLMHDHPLLKVLRELGPIVGRTDYGAAADRYLRHFATHCTDTPSGLFPWGEHAFWDIVDDRPGNGFLMARARRQLTHDHLNQAPVWLWEELWRHNPRCVERFAAGLDRHWLSEAREEYSRHAYIKSPERYHNYGDKSCDFPRHSGFYILDLAFAWKQTQKKEFMDQLQAFFDHWAKRVLPCGALPGSSKPGNWIMRGAVSVPQTLALALSLLETAQLLEDTPAIDLVNALRQQANGYLDGIVSGPHDTMAQRFAVAFNPDDPSASQWAVGWGSKYGSGNSTASSQGLMLSGAYRLTGRKDLLELARSTAHITAAQDFPVAEISPARDPGVALELYCDLFELTGEEEWLASTRTLLDTAQEHYCDQVLPRGASNIDWYESQLGTGYLLHGMVRAALLLAGDESQRLTPNYTLR